MSTATSSATAASPSPTPSDVNYVYSTSKIVKTAVAAGVIVLALLALVLFFKISSWLRYHQRLRRQHQLLLLSQSEQRATAYEIAAWADEPGHHDPLAKTGNGYLPGRGDIEFDPVKKQSRKERKAEMKTQKRGGANAYNVHEWEGVAA